MLAGTTRAQRIFLNTLRFLANDIRMPLVCAGTDEARHAILMDSQLAERFNALELPHWKDDAAFKRLLMSIKSVLPLRKPSPAAEMPKGKSLLYPINWFGDIVPGMKRRGAPYESAVPYPLASTNAQERSWVLAVCLCTLQPDIIPDPEATFGFRSFPRMACKPL